jgi:hypothetical protein
VYQCTKTSTHTHGPVDSSVKLPMGSHSICQMIKFDVNKRLGRFQSGGAGINEKGPQNRVLAEYILYTEKISECQPTAV